MKANNYVHGYSPTETNRLADQASTLAELLHADSIFARGSRILEAGCGTGAQTKILATLNPHCSFTSIDICEESLATAKRHIQNDNVQFQVANIYNLPFAAGSFDHVIVCFVLEHLSSPPQALKAVKDVLKWGGSVTVIEGDHGSAYYHPRSPAAQATIQCLIDIQESLKGNSLIGRELYPLLCSAGYRNCSVSPRMVYADAAKPELVDGFTKKTFIAMVEGVKRQALQMNLIDEETWQTGINDLYRTTEKDGTFCYAFFKGIGYRP